jgi:hypothetical protein
VVGAPALPTSAGLGLEQVYQIDRVVEPPADTGPDTTPGDGDRQMSLAPVVTGG